MARPADETDTHRPRWQLSFGLLAPAASTAVAFAVFARGDLENVVMVYLLAIMFVAYRFGRATAVVASLLSVAAFDFCFVPPFFTFAVRDARYWLTFAVMLVVGLVISGLTDRVRAQAADVRERERRAEREALRAALLSSVSHDLRTPLGAITGAATTVLEDEALDPEVRRDLLRTISQESDRLNRLVGNLLAMTQVESGGLDPQKDWVPFEEIVGPALERLAAELAGREVRVDVPEDLPLVEADGVLLGQALVNLLENAAKHTPASSPIELAARADGELVIEVRDRGPGLPAGSEGKVFEKFWRAPGARSRGTGLGLAITKAIVVAHGGSVAAENREGGGAVFRLRVPLGARPPDVPEEAT